MKKIAIFSAAAAAGVAVLWILQSQSGALLRKENKSLRLQVDRFSQLQSENLRLSNSIARTADSQSGSNSNTDELSKLREEVSALRQQNRELENAVQKADPHNATASPNGQNAGAGTNAPAENPDTPINATYAVDQLRDAGNDAIESAAQTVLWAVLNRDEQALDRIRYRNPISPEASLTNQMKSLGEQMRYFDGATSITFANWSDTDDHRRRVYFTPNWPGDAAPEGKSNKGALIFRQVDSKWQLDQFQVFFMQ